MSQTDIHIPRVTSTLGPCHQFNLELSFDDFTRRTYKLDNSERRCVGLDPPEDDLILHHNGDNAPHFLPRSRYQSNTIVTGEYPQSKTQMQKCEVESPGI